MAYKEIEREDMKFVNELLLSKNDITEQLTLLRKYRNREDVERYIEELISKPLLSDYVKYLIDRYYYGNKNAVKAEKNCIEKFHKVLLRPVMQKERIINHGKTDIQVGDNIIITGGTYANMEGEVLKVDNEYSELIVLISVFGKSFSGEVDFQDAVKKE